MGAIEWRKSSYCGTSSCVEVAMVENGVMVRDSKEPETDFLIFTREEWRAFITGVLAGEFG